MLSFDSVPLDPLVPKLMMWLSVGAQIPTTQRLVRIDYIIECRIQAVTSIKHILAVISFKYQNKFITPLTQSLCSQKNPMAHQYNSTSLWESPMVNRSAGMCWYFWVCNWCWVIITLSYWSGTDKYGSLHVFVPSICNLPQHVGAVPFLHIPSPWKLNTSRSKQLPRHCPSKVAPTKSVPCLLKAYLTIKSCTYWKCTEPLTVLFFFSHLLKVYQPELAHHA